MSKKYGDTVLFKRGEITVNALVLQSAVQPDGEHLTLVYLDPAFDSPILGGSAAQRAVATAFTVPYKEGAAQGWIDADLEKRVADLEKQATDLTGVKPIDFNAPHVVVFGEGKFTSTPGTSNGFPAVILEPVDAATGSAVLEFHGPEGANVLIAQVGALFPPAPPAQ